VLLDVQLESGLKTAGDLARRYEDLGVAGVWSAEITADPTLALAVAAVSTTRVTIGSNVVLAFTRNPMSVAMQAWDLAAASEGRFVLGLATQVKAHITRRFGMPWSDPVPRLRDFVAAVRHIFGAFQGEHPMDHRGAYYSHTLLHPLFNPGPIDHPDIPIALGGVGPALTALAGQVADGYMAHAFTNTAYQDKVTIPALERGLAASGRTRADLWTLGYLLLAVGDTDEEQEQAMVHLRNQVAFYASSPMYTAVLDAIGCGALQGELEAVVKAGRWGDLPGLVDDEVLDHFVLRGTLEELPDLIRKRYGGYYDRAVPYLALREADPDRVAEFVRSTMAPLSTPD
jgi:probable F420-dependent oxidoreductase